MDIDRRSVGTFAVIIYDIDRTTRQALALAAGASPDELDTPSFQELGERPLVIQTAWCDAARYILGLREPGDPDPWFAKRPEIVSPELDDETVKQIRAACFLVVWELTPTLRKAHRQEAASR